MTNITEGRTEGLALNTVHEGDCLELMRDIPDGSVDLIVIDPPYNIGKDKRWDKWDTVDAYVAFMGDTFTECERVLKDNGSFYWFHNDMTQIRRLMDELDERTSFVYKQFIVWNKRFNGASNKGFLDGFIEVEGLRNYQKMAEYCLFYTLQEDLNEVIHDTSKFTGLRNYFAELLKATGRTKTDLMSELGQRIDHCFRSKSTQWSLPTPETYNDILSVLQDSNFDVRSYESIKEEYDTLREQYDNERYTYNNQRTHHSVWNYEVAPKLGHITPKPVELIDNIIQHSSNEGDIVLDCFGGSGTTAVAAKQLNRNYILIEREPEYVAIANERIAKARAEVANV